MSGGPDHDDDRAADVDALWRVLASRRDHRHFHSTPIPRETIERLLSVFAVAPSVGLSQPWHVTVVQDRNARETVHAGFREVRAAEAERFSGQRRELYDSLRLEGILQAPVGLVVSHQPPGGPVLGTTSMPSASEYSVISAITLLWLAATAEGLGMGWVSLLDPSHLSDAVPVPDGAPDGLTRGLHASTGWSPEAVPSTGSRRETSSAPSHVSRPTWSAETAAGIPDPGSCPHSTR